MRVLRILPGVFFASAVLVCALTLSQARSVSPDVKLLIEQSGAIETWQACKRPRTGNHAASKISPLVAQAQIYAKLLNPPALPKPQTTNKPALAMSMTRTATAPILPRVQATPQKVSPSFKVHATSVFAKHPERSMALISEPGKGIFWIRPGHVLGYLKVTEIRKDAVVYEFKDRVGQVAWEPSSMPASQHPGSDTSSPMAMDLPNSSPGPSPLAPVSTSPLPSRLGAPQEQSKRPASSPPHRGGR